MDHLIQGHVLGVKSGVMLSHIGFVKTFISQFWLLFRQTCLPVKPVAKLYQINQTSTSIFGSTQIKVKNVQHVKINLQMEEDWLITRRLYIPILIQFLNVKHAKKTFKCSENLSRHRGWRANKWHRNHSNPHEEKVTSLLHFIKNVWKQINDKQEIF